MKKILILAFFVFPLCISAQKNDKNQKPPISDQDELLRTQTIAEDLVVQGSECVGIDCATTESFGFDTERYKENNLRIHFDDTSTGTFPANDWRITINDSGDGGDNYFGVEDATAGTKPFHIDAGSGNDALHISSSGGNVGLGTATPVVELHVADGDTPTLRLEQNADSGFTSQTWDLAGNETNFFIRDITNSSSLPFRIKPGTSDNAIYISEPGIGFGTASPLESLHVNDSEPVLRLDASSSEWNVGVYDDVFTIKDTSNISATTEPFQIEKAAPSNSVYVSASGNVGFGTDAPMHTLHVEGDIAKTGSIIGVSDKRIKTNINSIAGALAIINALDGKSYDFKTEDFASMDLPAGKQYGLIAQEVEEVLESLVRKEFMDVTDSNGRTMKINGVNYEQLIPILINAINEQNATIEKLTKESKSTNSRLAALEAKLLK